MVVSWFISPRLPASTFCVMRPSFLLYWPAQVGLDLASQAWVERRVYREDDTLCIRVWMNVYIDVYVEPPVND